MVRTGEVVERGDGTVSVVFERPEACASCNGCVNHQCTRIDLPADADVGDMIDVEMPEKTVVKASMIFYIVPLCLMLLGMYVGSLLYDSFSITSNREIFAAICGLLFMAVGFYAVYRVDKGLRNRQDWEPKVIKVHKKEK